MNIATRLRASWRDKVAVCLGLAVGICVPYFGLQQVAIGWPLAVPATALDVAVPFSPGWTPVYLSIGALVPLAPWLAPDRDAVLRYAWGLALLCLPSFVLFALLPATGPRPEIVSDAGLYGLLAGHDRPTNSLPSLHAGLTVYSLLVIGRVLGRDLPPLWRIAGWTWGAAILASTLLTKQHWALDLPPGIALALLGYWLAWRGFRTPDAAQPARLAHPTRPSQPTQSQGPGA